MDNVPVRSGDSVPAGHATGGAQHAPQRHHQPKPKASGNKLKVITMAAAVTALVLVILLSGVFLYRSSMGAHIDNNKYQAVFFTNGQVYFGKLQKLNGGYFKLNDIFYLQAKPEADTESTNPQETTDEAGADVQLIKLGSEVHGPDDEMIMSKDQILFFENLSADGKVSESISQYHGDK